MTDNVFDLDAVIAEADAQPFRFLFGGDEYELPPGMDLQVALDLDAGNVGAALRRLMGEEQYERLAASDAVFDTNAFGALMVAYQEHMGGPAGGASASSSSSGSTGRPSKRTSSGSTKSRSRTSPPAASRGGASAS